MTVADGITDDICATKKLSWQGCRGGLATRRPGQKSRPRIKDHKDLIWRSWGVMENVWASGNDRFKEQKW
jgi:hypothetical protein